MDNEEDSWVTFAVIFPALISIFASMVMCFINFQFRSRQTVLTDFVLALAASDFVYSLMGLFLAQKNEMAECPVLWVLIRNISRLASFCFTIAFALTLKRLIISGLTNKMDLDPETVRHMFKWSFLAPFIWTVLYIIFFPHNFLDVICWEGNPDLSDQSIFLKYYMELPIFFSVVAGTFIHSTTLVFLKKKLEQEGNFNFIKNLYELFVYPLGIVVCYFWFFMESFQNENRLIRRLDIFFQQSQGLINFFIFGLNYQTRTYIKTYCQKGWMRIYGFFHVTDTTRRQALEMQTVLMHDEPEEDRPKPVNYF